MMMLVGAGGGWGRGDADVRGRGVGTTAGIPGDQPRGAVPVLHADACGSGVRGSGPGPGPSRAAGLGDRVVYAAVAGIRAGSAGHGSAGGAGSCRRAVPVGSGV